MPRNKYLFPLIIVIIGGAIAPLFMGLISDSTGSIQNAYIVPLLCFIVVFYYAVKAYRPAVVK